MFQEWKAHRAEQARLRRENKKKRLKILEQQANSAGATAEVKKEFLVSQEKRNLLLQYDKKRIKKRRNNLKIAIAKEIPIALEKAKKKKKARRLLYLDYKKRGKVKLRKAKYRCRKRFEIIKTKIEGEQKDINSRFLDFKRTKITPLGAAVRYCDLEAVRYVLEKSASPTRRCTSTMIYTPLYDAAWKGKSEIAQLLLENSALPEGGATGGALHGAIHNRMFKTIHMMLDRGCQVNEDYLGQTPLGAALTCGKSKSGDVRLVRILLSAKADVMKKTTMSDSPWFNVSMGTHTDLATKYSNRRCLALLNAAEVQTKSDALSVHECDNLL